MSVKAINSSENARPNRLGQRSVKSCNPQFTSSFNPVVTVTDAIARGGFAASFIAQDGLGMVAPRIWEGLNRGRERAVDPETGEKTGKKIGPYNWTFARREGVREILSGPSAFLIPLGIMAFLKKYAGKANNVPINMINTLGENFKQTAISQQEAIKNITDFKDAAQTKPVKFNFYKQMFKSTLEASLGGLKEFDYDAQAEKMANKLLEIEAAKSKGFFKHFIGKKTPGMKEDLTSELVSEFMDLRKKYVSPTENELAATVNVKWRRNPVSVSFNKMLDNMMDYTDDVIKSTSKYLKNNAAPDLAKFLKSFNLRRSGSRLLSNFGMFFAVVGFYDIIPKIYNIGVSENADEIKDTPENEQKENAAEAENTQKTTNKAADTAQSDKAAVPPTTRDAKKSDDKKSDDKKAATSFTGAASAINEKLGKTVTKGGWFKKLSDTFEFDGASMSVPAMLTLLFGFCLPPRLRNAKGEHDRREIEVRDISSFIAILFGAKTLSRSFSTLFAKISGLALNVKPADHDKGIFYKLKNYLTPSGGVTVLSSEQLASKHSNLKQYKDGVLGYIEFLNKTGGDPRKVFAMDKTVKNAAEDILTGAGVKFEKLKDVSIEDLEKAFKQAMVQDNNTSLETIYKAFESADNKFVRIAKTLNSSFDFASIILIVPAFMIWLARYCEKMTKENKEKERLAEEAKKLQMQPAMAQTTLNKLMPPASSAAQPTMAGFLKR